MSIQISGKLLEVSNPESKTGKNGKDYITCLAIIEVGESYPKKVAISLGKEELINQATQKRLGEVVSFDVNIESREYNGKWFTNINAWKIN